MEPRLMPENSAQSVAPDQEASIFCSDTWIAP
jgi:hypothetical protein